MHKGFYDIGFNAAFNNNQNNDVKGFQRLPASVINFNFAAELFIKALLQISFNKNFCGHDILKLYSKLPSQTKVEIEILYKNFLNEIGKELSAYKYRLTVNNIQPKKINDPQTVLQLLETHKNSFIEWRYLYENNHSIEYIYDFDKMDCFIRSLITILNKIGN